MRAAGQGLESTMHDELLLVMEQWRIVRQRSERTVEYYRHILGRMATFGLTNVSDVTPQRLASYVLKRCGEVRLSTVKTELAALLAQLTFLCRSARFPFERLVELRALVPAVKLPRRLSATHLDRNAFEVLRAASPSEEARFIIGVDTLSGLRAGELARMRWEDATLDRTPSLRVRIVPELGRLGTIKTGQERTVPVCAELRALLIERQERTREREGYIFRHGPRATKNVQATVKTLRRSLVAARQRAGLEWVTFHVLRHTRASWWVQAGVPIAKVAHWLGHSLEVCERHYAGLREGYDPDCERMPAA